MDLLGTDLLSVFWCKVVKMGKTRSTWSLFTGSFVSLLYRYDIGILVKITKIRSFRVWHDLKSLRAFIDPEITSEIDPRNVRE